MSKQREVRYMPARELRATKNADGSRTLSGYAAVFNALSVDFYGWRETIAPGAFTRSLMADPDVVCLRDHDNAILLGRTASKTLKLEQDAVGLRFECVLPDTTQAADLCVLIDRGDINGCSFAFSCNLDDWKTIDDGTAIRTVIEADLYDVSVVTQPAYPDTSVSLRSAPKDILSAIELRKKKAKRDDVTCQCPCGPCVDGDCDGCTDDDCMLESCSCSASTSSARNRAYMVLEMAKHRTK
jgi:HK97 family phage prohead protease